MCDRCFQSCQSCWSKNFYKQYLEQHSAMTQWLLQISQSHEEYLPIENPPVIQYSNNFMNTQSGQLYEAPVQWNEGSGSVLNYNNYSNPIPEERIREHFSSSDESSSEGSYESESDMSRDDIIGSDDEIYFDPGCFLELGSRKDSLSEKSDDESDIEEKGEFEFVDSVIEEFEYVQLDKFGNMSDNRKGRKGRPHAEKEMRIEKETREYLYGEKADTIAGLETAMTLDFNRICDLYQPHLWPVLPVRLSKV